MGKRLEQVFGRKVAFGLEGGYNLQVYTAEYCCSCQAYMIVPYIYARSYARAVPGSRFVFVAFCGYRG